MDFSGFASSVLSGLIVAVVQGIASLKREGLARFPAKRNFDYITSPTVVSSIVVTMVIVYVIVTRVSGDGNERVFLRSSNQPFESQTSIRNIQILQQTDFSDLISGTRLVAGSTITFAPDKYMKEGAQRLVPGAGREETSALELTFQARCASLLWGAEPPTMATVKQVVEHPQCTPMKEFISEGITDESTLLVAITDLHKSNLRRNGQSGEVDVSLNFDSKDRFITFWVKYVADYDDGPPLVVRAFYGESSSVQKEIRDDWVRIDVAPGRAENRFRLAFWFDREPVKGGGKLYIDDLSVWHE